MDIKLALKINIILTGFMATGKTTVGKLLAAQLGYEFIDTDELIEVRQGRSIADIFLQSGEATFRRMETDLAEELADHEGLVISTGGGMMLNAINVDLLSQRGRIFCLVATPEEILSRLKNDKRHPRPLLEVPNPSERIIKLFRQREKVYQRFPQVMTSDKQPAEVAAAIVDLI